MGRAAADRTATPILAPSPCWVAGAGSTGGVRVISRTVGGDILPRAGLAANWDRVSSELGAGLAANWDRVSSELGAGLAANWEEVVLVGGGIRTGARTGVELDKQNEVDGADEGKILAGGAAAEQANCLWLISGETVTLIFSKSQCPEWGQPQRLAERFM